MASFVPTDGNDTYTGSFGRDLLFGGLGNDKLSGGENNDSLHGGAGDDTLIGGNGGDIINGDAGKDSINGGNGDDQVFVGYDSSFYDGRSGVGVGNAIQQVKGDKLNGGHGVDTLFIEASLETKGLTFKAATPAKSVTFAGASITGFERYAIWGGSGKDVLTGYVLNDRLYGNGGDDKLSGLAGNDSLIGGAGKDTLLGGNGRDTVEGGDGNDSIEGGAGSDNLSGETYYTFGSTGGNDTIKGGAGDDFINGNGGKNVLNGEAGNDGITFHAGDKADGGSGVDRLSLDFSDQTNAENFKMAAALTFKAGGTAKGFEILDFDGGSGADKVTGGAQSDYLYGGDGNDSLVGGKGSDQLDGGDGNDTVRGGADSDNLSDGLGADKLYGEDGNDFINVSENGYTMDLQKDVVDGGAGTDSVTFYSYNWSVVLDLSNQKNNDGYIKGDTFTSIERFTGTGYDDILKGGSGNDRLDGNGADDILVGGGGNDTLIGNSGADHFTGGAGKDFFELSLGFNYYSNDTWLGDTITDFKSGQDKIGLYGASLGLGFPYNKGVAITTVSGTADPVSTASKANLIFNSTSHELWFDMDGKGGEYDAVLLATLEGVKSVKASDFDFVTASYLI
ncbi:calcium-binding protein [Sphingomonas sp. ID0503]|uniref:calcium-binding protein n=1 Tax=Sphingomonas sp. ID0503 TaxID=3399691 RepID=UPI003AFAAB05